MKFQKRLKDFAMMRDLQKCIDKELELIKFPKERHLKVIKGGKSNG